MQALAGLPGKRGEPALDIRCTSSASSDQANSPFWISRRMRASPRLDRRRSAFLIMPAAASMPMGKGGGDVLPGKRRSKSTEALKRL